ncbi:MAG: ADP-ribose pyrophosphatase [Thiotrichales bacterium SG8_50]|jgi:ADP-ribose pyrophosphatase YjhB (NUDIX family)|nr:MAG: ADP-ribose pyrophosphatase [Thiotrichales bacterium SG8_50]
MKYCSHCASPVVLRVPEGDNLPRFICDSCNTIHYQNPNIVAGCVPEWDGRLLLCRRAIEPRHGLWTLPAGYMENNETTLEAARRETVEEAGAEVDISDLFAVINLPHINQVYMMFRAQLNEPKYAAGPESLEVKLFREAEIPWGELAFPVIQQTLKCYYDDLSRGEFQLHVGDMLLVDRETRKFEVRFLESGSRN